MFCKSASLRLVGLVLLVLLLPESIHASALFKPAYSYPSGGDDTGSVAIADLNGDGKPDLVVSNYVACATCTPDGSVGVLLGNGDGTFQVAQTYDSGANGARGVAVADVNGDGKLDVLVANSCASGIYCDGNSNTGSVAVLLGRGDGSLRRARVYSAGGLMAGYIVLGDFNGDSKLDVAIGEACGCGGHRKIAVLLGNGDGTLQSAQSYDLPGEPQGITAGDLNGDGAPDLVVGVQAEGQQSGSVAVLLGNGDGSFQKSMVAGAGVSPVLDDVNGDGKLDLVVAACGDPKCSKGGVGILLGNGDGSFQAVQVYSSGGVNANFVALGDVNRDGKHDVFVANYSGKVGTLLGVGDGTVLPVQRSGAGDNLLSLAAGDVNGDGKPDLVVANWFSNIPGGGAVTVLLNNTFWKTTTALTSSPNPSVQGQPVTLAATITTEGSIAPTGKVVFKNGGTAIGSASLLGGVAMLIKGNLPVGTLSLTATYQGDTNSAKSTSPVRIQVVNPTAGHR